MFTQDSRYQSSCEAKAKQSLEEFCGNNLHGEDEHLLASAVGVRFFCLDTLYSWNDMGFRRLRIGVQICKLSGHLDCCSIMLAITRGR